MTGRLGGPRVVMIAEARNWRQEDVIRGQDSGLATELTKKRGSSMKRIHARKEAIESGERSYPIYLG